MAITVLKLSTYVYLFLFITSASAKADTLKGGEQPAFNVGRTPGSPSACRILPSESAPRGLKKMDYAFAEGLSVYGGVSSRACFEDLRTRVLLSKYIKPTGTLEPRAGVALPVVFVDRSGQKIGCDLIPNFDLKDAPTLPSDLFWALDRSGIFEEGGVEFMKRQEKALVDFFRETADKFIEISCPTS